MNNRGEVAICDFGLARYYHEPLKTYSPTVVTLWYRAPEVLLADGGRGEKTTYGPAVDVWSLGCIFAELVLRAPLLNGQGEIDQVKRIFELLGTPDEETWPGCTALHFLRKYPQRRQPFNRLRDKFKRATFTSATVHRGSATWKSCGPCSMAQARCFSMATLGRNSRHHG
jgi:cell division cycle 2-like protein